MTKRKRTDLDRQIELRQGIENNVYSIFFTAIKEQKTHEEILTKLYDYLDNYSVVSTLPRYMKEKITGASEALFRLIDWYFVETRYRSTQHEIYQFVTKEDIEQLGLQWRYVKRLGSFWKQEPHKIYSPE